MADATGIDYEAEYNNRLLVPDNAKYGLRWAEQSAATRAALSCDLDVEYGPASRNRYDMFWTQRRGSAVPLAVFVHGGVWQRGDRKDYDCVVDQLVARGVDVAVPSYTLCPEVKVGAIFDELRLFLRVLWAKTGRRPLVIGHSVGGTMAAAMMATEWGKSGDVPDDLVRAVYSISGVFDVEPYVQTTYNEAVKMTAEEARAVSPVLMPAPSGRQIVAAVGGAESREFVRQSLDLAARWSAAGVKAECVVVPGANHFSIVDELMRPDSAMLERCVGMAQALTKV